MIDEDELRHVEHSLLPTVLPEMIKQSVATSVRLFVFTLSFERTDL